MFKPVISKNDLGKSGLWHHELIDRVQKEANPPVVFGRLPSEYVMETLLDDLVRNQSWLPRNLKEALLSIWVNDYDFDEPDVSDPVYEIDRENLFQFAAMDPVVDLESLRQGPKS